VAIGEREDAVAVMGVPCIGPKAHNCADVNGIMMR
jgi:hypothetical protein